MIKLIGTDIDGTLLGPQAILPPQNRVALAQAHAQGVRIAMVTVRKCDTTDIVVDALDLPCFRICQAGAVIYDENGTFLHQFEIPRDLVREIALHADAHGFPMMGTFNEVNYYTQNGRPTIEGKVKGQVVKSLVEVLDSVPHPPTRLMIRGEAGVNSIATQFAQAPIQLMRHYTPDGRIFDAVITSELASKGSALAWLCQRWGIDLSETMALGDSEADIGMIKAAGIGVAMGNAHASVKAAADWVAPHAGDAGLAVAVQRFVLV